MITDETYEKIVGNSFDDPDFDESNDEIPVQAVDVDKHGERDIFTDHTHIPPENFDEPDLEKERYLLESEPDFCYTVQSDVTGKYVVEWSDLTPEQQELARTKAIAAFDDNDAWDRSSDLNPSDFKNYKNDCIKKGKKLIALSTRWVDVAKVLQDGTVIGKSRLTTRGFDDHTWESMFYSSSPTVSSASLRISLRDLLCP